MEIVIVLDDVRSLHNAGSIFRTADAAGVKKIYLCGITPQPVDRLGNIRPQFAKVSLGADQAVSWEVRKSACEAISELKQAGFTICAVEQSKKSVPYYSFRKKIKKIALILGNEVDGVSAGVLKEADAILEIPMHGKKESLNVAVAAGIILFGLQY